MDFTKLEDVILKHEDYKRFVYNDSLGFATIGIGRCVDHRKGKGISVKEAQYLLNNDLVECEYSMRLYDWYNIHDDVRKCALIELCFNIGLRGLLGFKNTLECLSKKDYVGAAKHLIDSRWAIQVGEGRSRDIAYRIEHGSYQE